MFTFTSKSAVTIINGKLITAHVAHNKILVSYLLPRRERKTYWTSYLAYLAPCIFLSNIYFIPDMMVLPLAEKKFISWPRLASQFSK